MVKAKKHLGQHFLRHEGVALAIVKFLKAERTGNTLEIGPGTGVLTKYLLEREGIDLKVVELDGLFAGTLSGLGREDFQ
jgi:16S rRNA (adenine1518-N6/adenine1519-N6)-dimethyltransferase